MKFVVVVVILLMVGGGAGGYWWWSKNARAAEAAEAGATPTTANITRQNIRVTVDAYGAVSSNQDVDIKCQASGVVNKLPYTDVSAHVPPGALLMHLDEKDEQPPLDLATAVVKADESRLQEAKENCEIAKMNYVTTQHRDEATLAATKATLDDGRNKAKRTEELFKEKLASAEDLETANTAVATADGAYVSAQVAIDELPQAKATIETKEEEIKQMDSQLAQDISKRHTAQQNLDYCTVNAPDAKGRENDPPDWYISSIGLNLNIGYLVQSGSSGFSGGTTVMTLSDMSHVYVLATVDESDFGTLLEEFNAGQELPVVLTADAFRNVHFYGKVVRIATKGVNTSNVVTFEVKIEVTSPNRSLLRPIMTTNVQIITGQRQNCLAVPVQAVPRAHDDVDAMIATYAHLATTEGSAATKPASKKQHQPNATMPNVGPREATVEVVKPDGSTEERKVVVGLTDGNVYEVISGLEEGETVKLQKFDADSRWHGEGNKKNPTPRAK